MNENYCALVCKCIFQMMNELWYEQCYMIMCRDELNTNHGAWMQELI